MIVSPYPQIGWETAGTHSSDPRIPVMCPWCWGSKMILESLDLGLPARLIPIVCRRCKGAGKVRIERRGGPR